LSLPQEIALMLYGKFVGENWIMIHGDDFGGPLLQAFFLEIKTFVSLPSLLFSDGPTTGLICSDLVAASFTAVTVLL